LSVTPKARFLRPRAVRETAEGHAGPPGARRLARLDDATHGRAPHLEIALVEGALADDLAARLGEDANDAPLRDERMAWLSLYEAARISLWLKTAIVFL